MGSKLPHPNAHNTRRTYGVEVSPEEYLKLYNKQHGVCKICGEASTSRALSVDHSHKTGDVRGLLCLNCNSGLAMFKDDIRLLAGAIVYLEESVSD